MISKEELEALGALDDPDIPERKFPLKREGWYTFNIEDVAESLNVDDPEHAYAEYNLRCRIVNGPSKGIEFIRIAPAAATAAIKGLPKFRAKQYENDAPVLDGDGQPVYADRPNGFWFRVMSLTNGVMNSVLAPEVAKGSKGADGDRAKARVAAVEAAGGSIASALLGRNFIAKLVIDDGSDWTDQQGRVHEGSRARKENPKPKFTQFMPYSEQAEAKYVTSEGNMSKSSAKDKF